MVSIVTVLFLSSLSTSCNIVLYTRIIHYNATYSTRIHTRYILYIQYREREISHRPEVSAKTLETFFPSKPPENLRDEVCTKSSRSSSPTNPSTQQPRVSQSYLPSCSWAPCSCSPVTNELQRSSIQWRSSLMFGPSTTGCGQKLFQRFPGPFVKTNSRPFPLSKKSTYAYSKSVETIVYLLGCSQETWW